MQDTYVLKEHLSQILRVMKRMEGIHVLQVITVLKEQLNLMPVLEELITKRLELPLLVTAYPVNLIVITIKKDRQAASHAVLMLERLKDS
jgi:hypothetical protein